MEMTSKIGEQVKLPASVAFEVVTQGIRIRLGRSIVTMMGVVLGIAFLMATLSGESIKKGVAEEEHLRATVRRMANFLTAETGPPMGRRFGVLVTGEPSPAELRLVQRLRAGGAEQVRFALAGGIEQKAGEGAEGKLGVRGSGFGVRGQSRLAAHPQPATPNPQPPEWQKIGGAPSAMDSVADGANAVLVMGNGGPIDVDWPKLLARARNKVVAFCGSGRPQAASPEPQALGAGITAITLQQQLGEREQVKLAQDKRRGAFRRNWIVIISLLASVISISNAMLMSVTERFREIGTMKCLGALSSFIRMMFLIESSLMGMAGSVVGCVVGLVFSLLAYGITYGFGLVFGSLSAGTILLNMALCLAMGVALSVLAAFYPARIASRMLPAHALRTNV